AAAPARIHEKQEIPHRWLRRYQSLTRARTRRKIVPVQPYENRTLPETLKTRFYVHCRSGSGHGNRQSPCLRVPYRQTVRPAQNSQKNRVEISGGYRRPSAPYGWSRVLYRESRDETTEFQTATHPAKATCASETGLSGIAHSSFLRALWVSRHRPRQSFHWPNF